VGYRSDVTARPAPVEAAADRSGIVCDQAIFTSVRSPTGNGYRLVAASPGIRPEEKVEITRRSPSHDSLCVGIGKPIGLTTYRVGRSRRAVACSCHAGREHTARGGERVYTHVLLLDRAAYRRFMSDPVQVHAALASILARGKPLIPPPQRLAPLTIPLRSGEPANRPTLSAPPVAPSTVDWIWAVAAELLAGRHLILAAAPDPMPLLECALLALPCHIREQIDASVGVKFSPARHLQLVLVPDAPAQVQRLTAGRDVQVRRADGAPPPIPAKYHGWFNLLQRWWREGRFAQIVELTSGLCADCPAAALNRVAAICEDLDLLTTADAATATELTHRYTHTRAETPAESTLITELLAEARKALHPPVSHSAPR